MGNCLWPILVLCRGFYAHLFLYKPTQVLLLVWSKPEKQCTDLSFAYTSFRYSCISYLMKTYRSTKDDANNLFISITTVKNSDNYNYLIENFWNNCGMVALYGLLGLVQHCCLHDLSFILCQDIASNNTGILSCWSLEQPVNLISEIIWIQILLFMITHLQTAIYFLYTMHNRLGAGQANSCYYQWLRQNTRKTSGSSQAVAYNKALNVSAILQANISWQTHGPYAQIPDLYRLLGFIEFMCNIFSGI